MGMWIHEDDEVLHKLDTPTFCGDDGATVEVRKDSHALQATIRSHFMSLEFFFLETVYFLF